MRIYDIHAARAGGSSEAVPLFWWQGWTGRWYVASVCPVAGFGCAEPGLYIVARREADGTRTPLMIGSSDDVGADLSCARAEDFARALAAGATEIHLHLIEQPSWGREAAVKDLARAWALPLASLTPFSTLINPPVSLPRYPAQ